MTTRWIKRTCERCGEKYEELRHVTRDVTETKRALCPKCARKQPLVTR